MKHGDVQKGLPQTLLVDTQANIEAIASPAEGMVVFASDINMLGSYNGSTWEWHEVYPSLKVNLYRSFV